MDGLLLSIGALIEISSESVIRNPKDTIKSKDNLLDALGKAKVNRDLLDSLDTMLTITCELLEEKSLDMAKL